MPDRAVLFVDGNNWYHSLKESGVVDLGRLDYGKISRKLIGARDWVATSRYYIGRVPQTGDRSLYADQRRFLASLVATDWRISTPMRSSAASDGGGVRWSSPAAASSSGPGERS